MGCMIMDGRMKGEHGHVVGCNIVPRDAVKSIGCGAIGGAMEGMMTVWTV